MNLSDSHLPVEKNKELFVSCFFTQPQQSLRFHPLQVQHTTGSTAVHHALCQFGGRVWVGSGQPGCQAEAGWFRTKECAAGIYTYVEQPEEDTNLQLIADLHGSRLFIFFKI